MAQTLARLGRQSRLGSRPEPELMKVKEEAELRTVGVARAMGPDAPGSVSGWEPESWPRLERRRNGKPPGTLGEDWCGPVQLLALQFLGEELS